MLKLPYVGSKINFKEKKKIKRMKIKTHFSVNHRIVFISKSTFSLKGKDQIREKRQKFCCIQI